MKIWQCEHKDLYYMKTGFMCCTGHADGGVVSLRCRGGGVTACSRACFRAGEGSGEHLGR